MLEQQTTSPGQRVVSLRDHDTLYHSHLAGKAPCVFQTTFAEEGNLASFTDCRSFCFRCLLLKILTADRSPQSPP